MAIQMRRGEKKDFKPEKLKIGEFAVPTDTGEVYIKTSESTTKGVATLDSSGKLEQMPTYSDVGAAPEVHKHSTDDITSGTLLIENGGTGASTQGEALVNLGTIPVYTTASSFISYPCTTSELIIALPYPSILILNVDSISASITDLPCSYGILTVHKRTSNRIQIIYNRSYEGQLNGNNLYFGNYNSLSKTVTWNKIFTNYSGCQVPIENGGTGGTDIYTAQNNLGLLKRYPDFSHLTLPETLRDVRDIFRLMENNSYIETTVGSNVSPKIQAICPVASGCLKIVRFYNQYTGYAEFHSNPISENSKWVGSLHNDRGFVWNKVYTSNCIIPIENGGTGATTTDQALTNLGAAPSNHAHSASDITSGTLPIENGGTGAYTAVQALENLGAVPQELTINSKPLSSDIELNCADIGAAEENHVHEFSELINTPTTLAGYGITDVLSNEHTHDFNSIT